MDNNKKYYAVIGDPVEHSRSPELYAPMFSRYGINAEFLRICVTASELSDIRNTVKREKLSGFAVTMPHKKAILPYLDAVSAPAQKAGAVNIVNVEDGRLCGHNTDGAGLVNALREAGVELSARSAVVLGGGGAGSAAKAALEEEGCAVQCISRIHTKTGRAFPIEDAIFSFEVTSALISEADILINATPLGMKNGPVFSDLSFVSLLKQDCTVLDMVYRCDRETALLKTAASRGLNTVAGERMLYHQGLLAFKLWTGLDYEE